MLPDKILKKLDRDVELYFGDSNPKLLKAARKLADNDWTWDEIRPLMSDVYGAGSDRGHCPNECCY